MDVESFSFIVLSFYLNDHSSSNQNEAQRNQAGRQVILAAANPDSNCLYECLITSYNRFMRPVQNHTDTLLVKPGLKLPRLTDVPSHNQTLLVFWPSLNQIH